LKNNLKKIDVTRLPARVTFDTPFGILRGMIAAGRLNTLAWHAPEERESANPAVTQDEDVPCYLALSSWLAGYLAGNKEPFPRRWLNVDGLSPATLRLYDVLETVPYGQYVTYGMVAAAMGSMPRAVGQLLRHNRFALVIPCHRVVGANSLKGYGGCDAAQRKGALLDGEGAQLPF